MPDNILKYIFRDKSGAKHTVWKSDYDADPQGFAKAYPDARFEVVNRKTGDRGHVSVKDVGAAQKEGFNLFTMKAYQKEHYEKPKTMKQRAQQVAQEYLHGKKQSVDYLHRPQSQMGRPHRNVPAKASPFVRSLYEIDNAQKGPDYSVDYTSPKATQQVYQKNQQVRRQAAKTASVHIANDEYRRQSQPMIDNGTVGVMKPMGEIEQEMSDSASKFVDANLGDYISKAVLGEQNAAAQRGLDAANRVPLQAGAGGMGLMVKGMAYNEQVDPDLMAKNLTDNARDGFLKLFQDPNFVAKVENEAIRIGVTPEAYMESIIPHLKDRLATSLQESEYKKALPKNILDNIANRFIDSNTIGKALRLATQTRGQRILNEQASAATAEGKNPYYKGGTVENVTADVAGMVADPIFGASAKLGGAVAGKLIGNSTKLAALMANGNLAQRLMAKGAQAVTSGGVTGFVFDSTGSVIQNYSTGEDTSLGNTLKVAAKGGATGAVNFATMSLAGIPLSEVGRSVGLKAMKGGSFWGNAGRATAKVGLESGKTYMEAMGMYLGGYVSGKLEGRTDANGKPIEFDLWNGTMESLPTAIGFRLQHAIGGLKGGRKNEKGEDMGWFGSTISNFKDFVTSDKAKESRFLMTEDERNQIFSSGAMNGLMPDGENIVSYAKRTKNKKVSYEDPYLETDASMIKNTYDQIMADPKVSWDAKAKFSAMVTGIMPSARPMMDYITFSSEDYVKDGLLRGKRKYVNEYSAKGELLSKIPYDNKVDRDNVVYKHNIVRENQRLYNAMGLLARQDRNNYEIQNDFFVENMKKPGADVNSLVTNMGNEGSDVFRDFSLFALNSEKGTVLNTIDSIAVRNGMKSEDLIKAMKKNPMKRTDFEQNVCVELRRALEAKAFPDGKVHVEQSNLNGKDVAEDNNLGTEQPNGEAVKQELNGLRHAEAEMDALIRDNDVFGQNFKKLQSQGLTNPQIYDWMVQQGGLTVEQLTPFAHYINANARVQGMQEATKKKIEETVSVFAQDWSYHGTLNGQPMNGEQALYVKDSSGRTLLVGSGDVSFDQTTGRAKEGSGDMLVCLDPNTKELVYVKSDEVTLLQNQPIDQFAAEYRQRLQMKNSEPYNQAAQEQAMLDAAKPQPKEQEAPKDNTTKSEDSTTKEGDLTKNDTTLTKVDTTSGEDNTTNENLAPQEQPQPTRKFTDGSDVPMTTDSKGRTTPDYASMTPEQSAEILTEDFGDNAEKVVDGQIQKAEKALKDAEKMKVDYTAEPNDIMEQESLKKKTVEAAKQQLEHAQNIKKVMTAKKVAETVGKTEQTDGAHEAGSVAAQKFMNAPRLVGNKRTRMLPDGETKIKGHYEIVPAESLTPSHDVNNDYKKSEGFPTDAEGRTVNDRDYEHDKAAQQNTDQIARKYNGMAIEQVPVVSDEGIVYDGNGRTMAGQKAAKEGTDGEYINDLLENAENFGFTREQIEQSGIEHPRLVMVTDERLPYDAATFAKFNRNEKKTQSNTEQAVAKAKTLTSDEVGAIVAEIEGNGSLEAFFNNSKAINDLVKTLVEKGIIGQNEVAQMMDSPERLSAQGREYVKNLLLGSIFKPETIRMLGIDSTVKNKAINAIRSVMDNMKLGEFSLRDEIDQAIQLLYEARQGGNKVDTLLRTPEMFGEDAAKRYSSISQMMALALEGKVSDFRDLLDEYNRIAKARNTGEGSIFEESPTKEELIKEFLDFKKWQDYGTGHSENEGVNDVSGVEEPKQEASGGNEPAEAGEGRVKSDLDRITETDEEFEVEGKYGTIYKKKYLIDGDKEVMKVDEPNKNGDYTGSYYEYNGKKYGDLRGVFEHLDDKPYTGSEEMPEGPIYDRKKALIDEINESDIKKKDDAFQLLYKAEDLLDDYLGIPHDEWKPEPSRSNTIAGILSMARNVLDRIKNEPVEPATEKQLSYLERLTSDDPTTRKLLEGVKLNKKQATWLIGNIKGLNDNLMRLHPDDIAETEKFIHDGIEYMKKLNGKTSDEGGLPLLPKKENPDPTFDPIAAAAAEFKKEHPLTEDEIKKSDVDDLSKDMALDYLNGEVTDDLHRAIYESIFAKTRGQKTEPKVETPKTEPSADPMEGIKNAAEGFEKEKKAKAEQPKKPQKTADDAAVAASNKKVNDLWDMLKNAGKDEISASFVGLNSRQLEVLPKLVSAMAENAYLRIKRGMHNLEDVVKEMRKEFAPAVKIFKKEDVDAIYEQMMNIRYRDGEQRMSLKEWADYYEKTSPKHQENLVGDSKDAEERKQKENIFINRIQTVLSMGEFKTGIAGMRKIAENCGLEGVKDTDLQELVETAVVGMARRYATSKAMSDDVKFAKIKLLYNRQPSLNQRDSERVMKQQYSTPAPYAYLANMYVKGNGKVIESALEPSAGNGMLTIGLPMDKVHVNDIDAQRLANLRRQGFKNVTSQDGTQPFSDKDVDVVVTNPPFGSATPKDYDGYKISSLEGQMVINALDSMKDDGRAAIIIGGKTEYAKNGSLNPKDKAFLGYLYSHYNVEDVINVDGSLYAKQGTSYPTRIILINGRRLDENAFPPVKDKARAETVKDYDELYKRIEDDILRGERMDSSIGGETRGAQPELDKQGAASTTKERVRAGKRGGSKPDGERESDLFDSTSVSGTHDDLENQRGTEPRQDGELPNGDSRADGTGTDVARSKGTGNNSNSEGRVLESGGNGRSNAQPNADGSSESGSGGGSRRQLQRMDQPVRGLSTEKVTYTPKSENPFTLKSVMPADQQEAVNKNLEKLGDADQFLVDELGYNDKDDLYSHLAAEQVDSVALALQQAKKGNAFIVGDQTGIGKGRQAASFIRYAVKNGQIPVYFTQKAHLLSDVYRDLVDIGSPELRPFILGSKKEATVTDSDGNVVYPKPSDAERDRVLAYIEKNGKLPKEYDYVLTTYSQVGNGVYEFDENGARKEKKLAKGKTFGAAAISGQRRRDAIEKLMGNAYLILDESHTAGGNSGQGNYFQHIIQKAKNVTFFSATFAKRPDNMPIYALRTAMNDGGMKASDLIDAVKRGGATLQEIMSQTLTQCGQMIRREQDMTGVTIDWKAIDDPERVQEQREQYDSIIGLFNDIINFQKKYVTDYVDKRNDELAEIQASIGIKKGTAALGIKNQPFASKAFNTVQQVLLSLKAKSAAERAIDYLKQGMKPVIALNNTNESQTGNLALGEEMDAPDLGTSLKKGLEGTLRYTQKDAKDNSESGYIKLSDLGDEAVEAYHELEKKIEQTSTGLSLSPIDVIKNELQKAGYKVGELTGRQTEFVYNDNGTVTKVKRADTDKKKLARDFNDGKIDALILNKSAATGISLHASSKYKDQKKRVMIVAQQQLDVNDEVQMRGRIDRTGQVARGAYEYVVSLIPAEQRLLMMFKAKLKSLDANTTSSQKSKFNEMEVADITNKYGDKVVREYMAEHLDLYARMADPFGWEKSNGDDLSSIDPQTLVASGGGVGDGEAGADASKLLGRMALLRVSEQEKMLQEIGELYANEIQRLNEMGENDLEITELPLKAKTLRKEVWKQGAEPGGDNAFADNTYIEKVNMAILKKPMKASEVKASQDGLTGGKTWDEYKTDKKAAVKEYFDQKIADETQKYEERAVKAATKAKEKYIKDGKKGQKDSGMSDEQIEKMAGYQYDNIYKQEKDKLNDVVKNLKAKAEMFERVLDTFDTNQTFVLPTDMNNPNELSGFGNSYGRLIDIKITDNYSPNASSVSFATLDGRRKITFPIAGKVGAGDNKADVISAIDNMTKQAIGMGDSHLRVLNQNFDNWDRLTSNESRKNGYIVTGNLMQALVDSKDQGLGGQLVKYTTDTGEVKTGILMPDRFDPKGLTTDAPINSVTEKFELSSWHGGIDEVTSSDGEVKVKRIDNNRGNFYELRVPKSKAKGGKYFMDEDLLKLVNGNNFETRGNNMLAEFKPEQLKPVLDRLSKMGVKVQEERKTSEDEGTHFREDRGMQYSKTDTKDVKNSRIIPEDVDKNVSSQIEKKFDDRVDELTKDLSNEDKAEFNRHLDYYTSEFSRYKASEITYTLNGLEDEVRFWGRTFGNREKAGRTHLVQLKRAELEAAKTAARREMDYREVRAKALADGYGLRRGAKASFADISRLFEATNQAKEEGTRRLFEKARDIAKRLGVEFGGMDEGDERGNVGEATPERNINLFIDTLSRTYTNPKEAAHTILHELIHQATMGAIHLVKDGKAEGMLTPKQIEAVKTVIDIYNKAKADGRIVWEEGKRRNYGGKDEYEFAAEMAGGKQRKILDLSLGERIMNAVNEFRNRGDNSLWQAVKNAWHKLFEISDKSKMDKALNDIMDDFNEKIDDIAMNDIEENGYAYRVTDKDELDRLNKEKTFRMYSGMQEVDGKLYSPMAAIIDGKRTDATEIGAWMGADERPDLVKNGKFQLVKTDKNPGAGEGPVPAAYNPYMHTSTSVMNDQFSGAYARGNIKVVEWEIPESEKTSGYHAEGAKNSVGLVPWTSGTVNSLLPKDRQRSVMLSRWRKAVRILPDEEVAEKIADQLRGTGLAIPWNVVTPSQLRELVKLGVPITTVEQGRQNPETKEKFLKQMAELEQEFPQAKFVNVKMTKDAYKEWGKNGGTKFRTDNGESNYPASSVENHIEKVAQKTGAKVNMVSSVDEITNKAAKAAIEEGRKITGWYDEKTGEVHLYMPNINDRYTAEKTIWHEVVGHKGMRELFGDERFDKFLREVWYDLDKPENAALKKLVDEERKFNPLNIYDAIEEGIARLAEDGKGEPGFWNGIKNKVSDFLHEIGYRISPNTKDVKYLLWLSKNLQKNPNDPYWKMRAEAVKYRLDHERMPAVVERNGMFFDNDGKNHDYLIDLNRKDFEEATDGKVHFRTSPMTASKIEEYNRRLGTKLYAFKESTVDHMQSLQEAMEIISGEKNAWTDIPSAFNPLQAQNRIDSIVQQKAEEYDRKYTKPLDDSFKKVVSTMSGSDKDEQLRNAQLYMITKHGLERNRVFFVRDAIRDMMNNDVTKANTLMKDWNDKQKDLADELEKGNIRFDEYLEQMDEWIRSNVDVNFVADEHDYSGFHGMQNIDNTSDPYDDKIAIDNVMSAESQMGIDLAKDFWTKKKAATDYVIDQEYYNGFIDNSDRDYLKGMFQWYVPLRKFDDTTAEDVYGYIGEKGDPSNFVGPVLANAKGRSSLSDINVMAQISAMAKSSLINGGKNVVKQHFARFVSAYETGNTKDKIFVEVNPWLEKHVVDGNEVWEEVTPQIPENATQQQISNILQNFEDTMQAKKATGDAKLSRRNPNIGFKFQRAKDKSEHIVDVYIAGKKRSFVCQGNPRAAQALNGLVKDSGTRNVATRFDAKITRKIAQFNTSLNPDFMMSNMLRDLTFASANVTKEGFAYTKDFLKEYAGNIISIKNGKGSGNYLTMFRKYRDGKLDINNERERMFKEFMDNGGQTGFVQIKKLESLIDEYDNLIKKGSKDADGWFVKKIKEGGTFIETANEIIENVARYSTYCTSRKHGRSVGRSIYDAKEVSTNFNRHGSGDAIRKLKTSTDSNIDKIFRRSLGFFNSWMKNHTQFYNAGVQGANLFFKNYKSAWKTTAVSFGMLPLGLGIAQALINQFLINNEDEKDRKGVKDPYAELPEWKRRNNICIYTGHGNFKTIPIAIELRAFFGLGDIAAGYVVNDKLKSSTPIGYDILGQMAQLVPASDFLGHHSPSSSIKELGEDALLAATPTTISPALELAFNRDWTGRPFYRDYDYLDKAPRWKRAYDNTNDIYMSINKWANQGTNGIDSSNADMKGNETLDYLTAPYAWQHLIDSYTGGMGSTIGRTYKTLEAIGKGVVSGAKNKEGFSNGFSNEFEKFDKNQIPLYRVFNYTPKEGQDMQRTRSKWYNYSDELKQTEYNIKQLKTNTPDVLKNMENNAKKFNFTHGEEGKAYNIWNAADNYIQNKKKILKRVSDPEVIKSINEDINRKMQEAVNDLDRLN